MVWLTEFWPTGSIFLVWSTEFGPLARPNLGHWPTEFGPLADRIWATGRPIFWPLADIRGPTKSAASPRLGAGPAHAGRPRCQVAPRLPMPARLRHQVSWLPSHDTVHGPWHGPWSMFHRGPWFMDHGVGTKNPAPWRLSMPHPWSIDHGACDIDHGPRTMDHGPETMHHGQWIMKHGH